MSQQQISRPLNIVQHVRIKASQEKVYSFLTQAELLMRWFPQIAATDPVVGGALRYEFRMGDKPHIIEGRYLELVPYSRVSYSWLEPTGDTLANLTVTFRLEAQGEETDLFLEETGFAGEDRHGELHGKRTGGWEFFLANLNSVLVSGKDTRSPKSST